MQIDPFDSPDLTPSERLVAAFIQREPKASTRRIAWMTGENVQTVVRALKRLREIAEKGEA